MVEVRHAANDEVPLSLQIQEQMQQRDRIRTARHGDEHTFAGAQQGVLLNRAPHAVGDRFFQCSQALLR